MDRVPPNRPRVDKKLSRLTRRDRASDQLSATVSGTSQETAALFNSEHRNLPQNANDKPTNAD
jgi:hypothetical protein